jgi:hypothetical protein
VVVLPDFVTCAGPELIAWMPAATADDAAATTAARVTEIIGAVGAHDEGHVLGACEMAERFLETWTTVPFGRPL